MYWAGAAGKLRAIAGTDRDRNRQEAWDVTAKSLLPKSAPFNAEEIDVLNRLVGGTTPLQRSWLSGFLAGVDAAQCQSAVAAAAPRRASR